jgi:hypothetical protein
MVGSLLCAKVRVAGSNPVVRSKKLDLIQWTVMSVFPRLRLFRSQIGMAGKHLEISVRMQDR